MEKKSKFPHFCDLEFNHANPPCSISDMKDSFMERLEAAREVAGIPFVINSAFRTVQHERLMKRSGTSMHCLGRAVDIRCVDNTARYKIITSLLSVGFTCIGIGVSFIHVDDRPYHLIWTY